MLVVHVADISALRVEAVVNAANTALLAGGGVDGAIHDAAGPELQKACLAHPEVEPGVRCPTGGVRVTDAFRMPARWVIHTAGPVWKDGSKNEDQLLASCYRNALEAARGLGAKSVAFPYISTGIFRSPEARAAAIAVRECSAFLENSALPERVVLVAFSEPTAEILRSALNGGWHR
ncbi:MAG: macro domain-containing protein [Myxococcota bacterium]